MTQVRAFAVQQMLCCSCHMSISSNRLAAFAGMLYRTGTNSSCICHLIVRCKTLIKAKIGQNLTITHHNLWLHATNTRCLHHNTTCHSLVWDSRSSFKVWVDFEPVQYVRSAACHSRVLLSSSAASAILLYHSLLLDSCPWSLRRCCCCCPGAL